MAERRVVKGWIVERGDDGAIRPIAPAGGAAPQPPADPTFPYKGEGAALDNASKRADMQNDAQRIAIERQRLALAQQAAGNAASAAQRANQISERDRQARVTPLNALNNQIRRVWDLYQQGPGATKGIRGAMDYLPTPGNRAFDTAGAGLAEIGLNAFRTPGVGSQSDKELKAFVEANRPSASDYDEQIREKLSNLENRLGEAYKGYGVPYKPYRPGAPRSAQGAPRKQPQARFLGWEK